MKLAKDNNIRNQDVLPEKAGKIFARKLLWANADDERKIQEEMFNMTRKRTFDLLVMSDVAALVYRQYFSDLVASISNLSDNNSTIILAYHKRHGPTEKKFFKLLAANFSIDLIPRELYHDDFRSGFAEVIEMFCCRKLPAS